MICGFVNFELKTRKRKIYETFLFIAPIFGLNFLSPSGSKFKARRLRVVGDFFLFKFTIAGCRDWEIFGLQTVGLEEFTEIRKILQSIKSIFPNLKK